MKRKGLGLSLLCACAAAGAVAALIGAALWAIITITTEYQIGFMAVGVGFLVGYAIRAFGQGSAQKFAIAGAALALLGCILGNLFTIAGVIAKTNGGNAISVAFSLLTHPASAANIMSAAAQPMDFLFYAIAIYEGYKLSRR